MTTTARRGFFPLVTGTDVEVQQAGGMAFAARNDLHMQQAGGRVMAAGHDLSIDQGGGSLIAAGNDITVNAGGGGLVAAGNSVTLTNSIAGIAVGSTVQADEGSKIIFGSAGSLAAGVLAGLALSVVLRLVRRVKS